MTQKEFQALYEEYKDKITDSELRNDLEDLNSFTRNNDVLLVTVVGTLKAGKSTFFNCIINAEKDISETKSEECTIHPNFVYAASNFAFKTYERINEGDAIDINKVLTFFHENVNTLSNQLSIREKNVKENIEEYVIECQNSKKYLFTSFALDKTNSQFIQKIGNKRIVFVDMPGDDGPNADANFDDFYHSILKRTDLVILVCSSAGDLGNSLKSYLQYIQENNKNVPFIIVMNKHEDKFTEEQKDDDSVRLDKLKSKLYDYNIYVAITDTLNAHLIHAGLFNETLINQQDKYKVDDSLHQFENFMNNVYNKFFSSETAIQETIEDNMRTRFQSQLKLFIDQLLNKINGIKSKMKSIDDEVSKIKWSFDEDEIKTEISNLRDNDEIAASFISKKTNETWISTNTFIDILKEYKKEYDKRIKMFVFNIVDKIKQKFSNCCNNISVDFHYEPESWKDVKKGKDDNDKYKSCFKQKILKSYNTDDLAIAMATMRNKLFPTTYDMQKIFEEVKTQYIIHFKEQEQMLRELEDFKNKLQK